MFGLSKFTRDQFKKTVDVMIEQNLTDSEVIGAKGLFVSSQMGEEKDRVYLDKETKGEKSFYIYHLV